MKFEYQISDQVTLDWVIRNMRQYLFPDLSKKKSRMHKNMIGVVATHEKKPVGLLLCTDDNTGANYRIHSFMTHPQYRKMGIGHSMINEIEAYVKKRGGRKIDLYYRSHWPSRHFLEKILTSQNWSEPKEDLIIVKGKASNVNMLFMHSGLELPAEYEFGAFREIDTEDRNYILKRKKEENWYLDYLDPFVQESSMCDAASLVLRKEGMIVGWVISHLIAPDLNEFTALFIDPVHRPYKMAHLLMREAITRQQQAGISNFLITSKVDNYVMSRFLLRHAKETGVFLTRSQYSAKRL